MYSFWELYSVIDLIKRIFCNTVKCVGKCGSECVKCFYLYFTYVERFYLKEYTERAI